MNSEIKEAWDAWLDLIAAARAFHRTMDRLGHPRMAQWGAAATLEIERRAKLHVLRLGQGRAA